MPFYGLMPENGKRLRGFGRTAVMVLAGLFYPYETILHERPHDIKELGACNAHLTGNGCGAAAQALAPVERLALLYRKPADRLSRPMTANHADLAGVQVGRKARIQGKGGSVEVCDP